MKKLIISLFLIVLGTVGFSQGLLNHVNSSIFAVDQKALPAGKMLLALPNGTSILAGAWEWNFDGTVQLSEINYDKVAKNLVTNAVFGVGPCVGYQHYIPTSATDPTPFNNYGFGAGALLGEKFKFIVQANILQYFKFGVTITPHPLPNLGVVGVFAGAGITFNAGGK
jgi:hypothetical protein